jgi:hypothetical protein
LGKDHHKLVLPTVVNQFEVRGEYTIQLEDGRVFLISNDGISIHENEKNYKDCLTDHLLMGERFCYYKKPLFKTWMKFIITAYGLHDNYKNVFKEMVKKN